MEEATRPPRSEEMDKKRSWVVVREKPDELDILELVLVRTGLPEAAVTRGHLQPATAPPPLEEAAVEAGTGGNDEKSLLILL